MAAANDRIAPGARAHGYDVSAGKPPTDLFPDADASFVLTLSRAGRRVRVEAGSTDVLEFVSRVAGNRSWDVLIGGAFLDIVPGVDPVASLFELVPGDPELPDERVRRWVDRRREQLDAANLTHVAHNLDVTGMVESTDTNAG